MLNKIVFKGFYLMKDFRIFDEFPEEFWILILLGKFSEFLERFLRKVYKENDIIFIYERG